MIQGNEVPPLPIPEFERRSVVLVVDCLFVLPGGLVPPVVGMGSLDLLLPAQFFKSHARKGAFLSFFLSFTLERQSIPDSSLVHRLCQLRICCQILQQVQAACKRSAPILVWRAAWMIC